MYLLATSKAGRSKKAEAEFLDLLILSGCGSTISFSNTTHTAFAAKINDEDCIRKLVVLLKSRGVDEIAAIKVCKGPYMNPEELLRETAGAAFTVNFRDKSPRFKSLAQTGSHGATVSVEVFGDWCLICLKRLV